MKTPRLYPGDHVRVIAPSCSLSTVEQDQPGQENTRLAVRALEGLGLTVSFGQHVREEAHFGTASVAARLADLHAAFADPDVDGVMSAVGGLNANQLLEHIDYDLIRRSPKVFCGYSDITVLNNAFLRCAGLVSFLGPHFSMLGMRQGLAYTLEHFRLAVMGSAPFSLRPSPTWSCDPWRRDQEARTHRPNPGFWALSDGEAVGPLAGGHIGTLSLLQGTPYMPDLEGAILLVEERRLAPKLDRLLQSILHHLGPRRLGGLLIGRFQPEAKATREDLAYIIDNKPALRGVPVVAGLDFGHTTPNLTLPIGGRARMVVKGSHVDISVGVT